MRPAATRKVIAAVLKPQLALTPARWLETLWTSWRTRRTRQRTARPRHGAFERPMPAAAAVPFRSSPVSQQGHLENGKPGGRMETSGNPVVTYAPTKWRRRAEYTRSPALVGACAPLRHLLHGHPRRHDRARGAAVDLDRATSRGAVQGTADQAATNEQVGGCDHPGTERNQR
jgi:hypothetical protein